MLNIPSDAAPVPPTLEALRKASRLQREAHLLLDALDDVEEIPGATLQRAFERVKRRRDAYTRAADAHWGPLELEMGVKGVAA